MTDEKIAKLFDDELKPARAMAAALTRLESVMHTPAELFFHTNKRRNMEYDRVPVGHDTGYRCYDGSKHDSESAFESGEYGDGMTEDEAYVDWLRNVDEATQKTRAGFVVHSSPFEPPTIVDDIYRDPDED